MITCYVRYVLDMDKLDAFAEYGRLWIGLITKLGGTHHGYFLPSQDPRALNHGRFSFPEIGSEGPTNVGVAIFSFPDWETYERYRAEAERHDECRRAKAIADDTKCFTSYERNFMRPISSSDLTRGA
ncbi:MAG TPA: NIPSNAP family protein [Vicinamibacterales bacterium]|nr:NIPSNAP family protein [Vicinamibacterales bacterium]